MLPMTESQITKPLLRRNVTCVYSSSDNLTAHCTHTAFEKVPRNLNPEIQVTFTSSYIFNAFIISELLASVFSPLIY